MPQMSPLSWLTLFIIFVISLVLFNILNYFSFITPVFKTSLNNKKLSNTLNWKW